MDYRELFYGIEEQIQLCDGSKQIAINFDNGATTPPFKYVNEVIKKSLNMYGAIHRGGQKAHYSTLQYDYSKQKLLNFFNLSEKDDYVVIYIKNTTEGINMLANQLTQRNRVKVLSTRMEHHANDLPWRRVADMFYAEVDDQGRIDLNDLEEKLICGQGTIEYVTVSAASNVTGYIQPIDYIAKLAHRYEAKIIVDAAQLVAHQYINLKGISPQEAIDFIVFSGHKMYAPFGTGVIIGKRKAFEKTSPYISGGGAVDAVLDNDVFYKATPYKEEAGTPNFLGVMAVSAAVTMFQEIGFDCIRCHERELTKALFNGLGRLKNIELYGEPTLKDRLGVISFNVKNVSHQRLALELANKRGIAVRNGCFCAQPYVMRLLGMTNRERYQYLMHPEWQQPGMVRVSFGLYNTLQEVYTFLEVLEAIIKENR